MNNMPKKLVYYRAKNNLTQKQLAEKLGVRRETVGEIERGKRTRLRATLAAKIEMLLRGEY